MGTVLRGNRISEKVALLLALFTFALAGAMLGAGRARACTTQYTYGQATAVFRVEYCNCSATVQGECIEITCDNNGECGSAPPTAIGCSNGTYCEVSCGVCI